MRLTIPKLAHVKDGITREILQSLLDGLNNVAQQTTASAAGRTPAPPAISSLRVKAQDGVHFVTIADNSPVFQGIKYVVQYSATPDFREAISVDLGEARNWHGFLGARPLYWRAFSRYPSSEASPVVYFGPAGNPSPVIGGGSIAGPTPSPSGGIGTDVSGTTNGTGNDAVRGDPRLGGSLE